MPLFTPHFTPGALAALRSARLYTGGHTGFTLPGGRLPNADGNLPPDTIGDGGGDPGLAAPPGTDEEAPPEPEPEAAPVGFLDRALTWVKTPTGMTVTAAAVILGGLGLYHAGKRGSKKNNRRR